MGIFCTSNQIEIGQYYSTHVLPSITNIRKIYVSTNHPFKKHKRLVRLWHNKETMTHIPVHKLNAFNGTVSLDYVDADKVRFTPVVATLPSSLSGNSQITRIDELAARRGGGTLRVLETPRMLDVMTQVQKAISPQGQSTLVEATLEALMGSSLLSLALAATGTGGHTTATALSAYFSKLTTVTTGSAENAILPAAAKWQVKVVTNAGAGPLLIYPQTGEFINGIVDTTPYTLAVGATASFYTLIDGATTKNWTAILWT